MPRIHLFSMGVVVLLGGALWFFWGHEAPVVNIDSTGADIIAFGDSLIAGVGAEAGMTLPEHLSNKLGQTVVNAGVSGETTRGALVRIEETLDGYSPRIVILSIGGNDFLQKLPRNETRVNIGRIIEKIQGRGAIVVLLGVRSGIIGGGFDEEFESLSKQYGTLYVEDVLGGIFGDTRYMSDAVHPNSRGYEIIAERIAQTLKERRIVK